jgi:hypothetical protein
MMPEYKPEKVFTVEEANARLPLVRAIVGDMVQLSREVLDRRDRLTELTSGRSGDPSDVYQAELDQVQQALEKDSERLQEFVDELLELGVEPKGATEGLVDFPAVMDGRLVYLCWQYDEPEVLFWHDLQGGFAGRQPLTVGTVADSDHSDGMLDA